MDLFVIDKTRLLSKVQTGHHFKEASLCDLEALCTLGCSPWEIKAFLSWGYSGVQGVTVCVPGLGIRASSSLDSTENRCPRGLNCMWKVPTTLLGKQVL